MRDATPEDDTLHPPTTDDIFWTETHWFAFSVPERHLTAFVYPVFRTNQSICSAGVYVWDDSAEADHEILYSHNFWHLPLPDDLRTMRLPSGLKFDLLEPLMRWRVRYDSDEVSFDVTYDGLFPPHVAPRGDHLDQPCHVTGSLRLHGEDFPVDCYEMRDKSWSVRSDVNLDLPPDFALGSYCYAFLPDQGFLMRTAGSDLSLTALHSGWLWREGALSPLATGSRRVERDGATSTRRLFVEGTDELGRSFTAVGETVNRFAFRSTPAILAWISGANWHLDGRPAWGEDQEFCAGSSEVARTLWRTGDRSNF